MAGFGLPQLRRISRACEGSDSDLDSESESSTVLSLSDGELLAAIAGGLGLALIILLVVLIARRYRRTQHLKLSSEDHQTSVDTSDT